MKIFGFGAAEVLLISVILGVVFGFLSISQAEQKGYNKGAFFCLGFFLGLIGFIIALVIPSKDSVNAASSVTAADSLLKYKELLDQGVITQDEFDAKKRELL